MAGFGDDDPEDAWDERDSLAEHVDVLDRWVYSIQLERLSEPAPTARLILRKEMALETILNILYLVKLAPLVRHHLETLRHQLEEIP